MSFQPTVLSVLKVFTSGAEMSWDTLAPVVPKCPATPADNVIMLDNYCAMLEADEE